MTNASPVIHCGHDGIEVVAGSHRDAIAWRDIAAVYAYKLDLMVVDRIALDLIRDDGSTLTINEHMTGYTSALESIRATVRGRGEGRSTPAHHHAVPPSHACSEALLGALLVQST